MVKYLLTYDYVTSDGPIENEKEFIPVANSDAEAKASLEKHLLEKHPSLKSLTIKKYERIFI